MVRCLITNFFPTLRELPSRFKKPRRIILLSLFLIHDRNSLTLIWFLLELEMQFSPFCLWSWWRKFNLLATCMCSMNSFNKSIWLQVKKGIFWEHFLQWIYKVILVLFIQQMFALWNVKLELTSPPFNVTAQHLFVEKAIHVALGVFYM